MKKYLHIGLLVCIAFILSACSDDIEPTMESTVADFEFTTQDEDTLSNKDLEGKWWVADFIFTNCETVCIPMTTNMVTVQEKLDEEGIDDVEIVSFSIEPDRDTPEVLTEYADDYGADLSNWTFLTGYDFETIQELSIKSFKNMVEDAPEGDDQIMHGTYFFLVNPEGEIIKNYVGTDSDDIDLLVEDIKNVH